MFDDTFQQDGGLPQFSRNLLITRLPNRWIGLGFIDCQCCRCQKENKEQLITLLFVIKLSLHLFLILSHSIAK